MKKIRRLILVIIIIVIVVFGGKWIFDKAYTKYLYATHPEKYNSYVMEYSSEYGLNPMFVRAIIKTESDFNTEAESNVGAKGLMQITNETGQDIAGKLGIPNFTPSMLYNPQINIEFGTYYLSSLVNQFNNEPVLVAAAYNAGQGNVVKWLGNSQYSSDGTHLTNIPFVETKDYVNKVLDNFKIYTKLYG